MAKKSASKGFIGWVAVAQTGCVYAFGSNYATKKAVENNLARCVADTIQIADPTIVAYKVYGLDDKERCCEEAQLWARDNSNLEATDMYRLSKVYVKVAASDKKAEPKAESVANEHPETCIFEIAKDYNCDSRFVKELFDCFMFVVNGRDYEEEAPAFKEMFDFMRGGKAMA